MQMKDGRYSHAMRIPKEDLLVMGYAVPFVGIGGGQFMNCGTRRTANCIIKVDRNKPVKWMYKTKLEEHIDGYHPILVVKAKRDIAPHEELLWMYPLSSRNRLGIRI